LDFRHRHVPQRRRIARHRARRAAGAAARRDRCALSRAGAVSRAAQRAGLCRGDRGVRRGAQRHRAGRTCRGDDREFLPAVQEGGPPGARFMRVTVLGCGPSWGVPAIGPDWGSCDPAEPRNYRRRCSLLVESRGAALLIDTSPDLRQQLLDAGTARLDAVLLTHAHADHLHGIDDIRIVNRLMNIAIPLYASADTLAEGERRFGYALKPG